MIKTLRILLNFVLISLAFNGYAAGLQLCRDENNAYVLDWADEKTPPAPDCEIRPVNSRPDGAVWTAIVPKSASAISALVIEGYQENGRFKPSAVRIVSPQTAADKENAAMPHAVLSRFSAFPVSAFGSEERIRINERQDSLTIDGDAGNKPAGLLFDIPARMFGSSGSYRIKIEGDGDTALTAALIERGQDIASEQQQAVNAGSAGKRRNFVDYVDIDADRIQNMAAPQLALLFPQTAASFHFTRITLEPESDKQTVAATWIWSPEQWQTAPEPLIAWVKQKRLNRLYLQLQITGNRIEHAQRLNALIALAKCESVELYIVEGDPAMATPTGLRHALKRAAAIKAFCTPGAPDCFSGIQYDIEPYILAEYAYQPDRVWQRWSQSIVELSRFWQRPIEVAVPFWMRSSSEGRRAADAVKPAVSNYVIMAYRSSAQEIERVSRPWLVWADRQNKGVIVALENGALPDEIHQTYLPAASGTLEKVEFTDVDAVILNTTSLNAKTGLNPLYRYQSQQTFPASRVSFMGDEAALYRQKRRLDFTQYRSFNGFALHGLNVKESE